MELTTILAFASGFFLHATLLEVCDYLGYPVYTQEDRELVWNLFFD